jgi:hypothetical protein
MFASLQKGVECIMVSCVRSLKTSIPYRSLQLPVSKTTVQDVLHKKLRLCAYTFELRHEIGDVVPLERFEYAHFVLSDADEVCDILRQVLSTDAASYRITRRINLLKPSGNFTYDQV